MQRESRRGERSQIGGYQMTERNEWLMLFQRRVAAMKKMMKVLFRMWCSSSRAKRRWRENHRMLVESGGKCVVWWFNYFVCWFVGGGFAGKAKRASANAEAVIRDDPVSCVLLCLSTSWCGISRVEANVIV